MTLYPSRTHPHWALHLREDHDEERSAWTGGGMQSWGQGWGWDEWEEWMEAEEWMNVEWREGVSAVGKHWRRLVDQARRQP